MYEQKVYTHQNQTTHTITSNQWTSLEVSIWKDVGICYRVQPSNRQLSLHTYVDIDTCQISTGSLARKAFNKSKNSLCKKEEDLCSQATLTSRTRNERLPLTTAEQGREGRFYPAVGGSLNPMVVAKDRAG